MREDRHPHAGQPELITAHWFPVYLEPVRHSGERLTIGVAVITSNPEQNRIVSTLPFDVAKCLYKSRFSELKDIADIALEEVRTYLKHSSDVEKFQFSLAGIEIGPIRKIREYSIEAMLNIAATSASSLSSLESDVIQPEPRLQKWQESIEELIVKKRPGLVDRFNRPLRIKKRTIANIGYVGNRFAANFHDFPSISNISYHVSRCSMDLLNLRAYLNIGGLDFGNNDWTGLIVHQPELTMKDLNRFNNHMDQLDTYADTLSMEVKRVKSAEEAAEIILADAG